METINRVAVTISFTRKFVDWANNLPDTTFKFTLETMNDDRPIYLVPAFEDLRDAKGWFDEKKRVVLEEAFESICTEEDWWPKDRSEAAFDEYLTMEIHSMVWDLADDEPLERDEL